MNKDYSEQAIREVCPFCDDKRWAFDTKLYATERFHIICDVHPLCEGHILIIPKRHVPCIGDYTPEEFKEFEEIYAKMGKWVRDQYGSLATFEHGVIGQTVFHSHVHLMPFSGQSEDIIPEGSDKIHSLNSLMELKPLFQKEGKYLFFSIGEKKWTVDTQLGFPRFFRDRFAAALGCPELANWKETRKNPALLAQGHAVNQRCQEKFYGASIST